MSTTVVGNMQQVIQMTPAAEKMQDMSHQLVNVAAQQKDEDRAIEDELRQTEIQDPTESNEAVNTDPDNPKNSKRALKRKNNQTEEDDNDSSDEKTAPARINETAGHQIDLVV